MNPLHGLASLAETFGAHIFCTIFLIKENRTPLNGLASLAETLGPIFLAKMLTLLNGLASLAKLWGTMFLQKLGPL